jgi:hypothetical protein
MSDEFLGDRKKALEESFFAKENQRLLERMREEKRKLAAKDALAGASRIQDDALLDRLVELEIGPDTWTALSLIPLVEVAWADGVLEARERRAILEAAANTGVTPGKASYDLLETWLGQRPDARLLEAWGEYVVGIAARLDETGRRTLHDEILGGARRIAQAAGGILGLGNKISSEEQAVLDRLDRAFD